MLLLPLLQLPNMHIFNNLYSALSFFPPQPCCLILIPYYSNSSAVLDTFGHVPYLGSLDFFGMFVSSMMVGKGSVFFRNTSLTSH